MSQDKVNKWSNTSRTSDRPEFYQFNKDKAKPEEQAYLADDFEYKPKHNRLDLQAGKVTIKDNSRHLHYAGMDKSKPVHFHLPPSHSNTDDMPNKPDVDWGGVPTQAQIDFMN